MKLIYGAALSIFVFGNTFSMVPKRITGLSFHPKKALLAVGGNQKNRGIINTTTKEWKVIWGEERFGETIDDVEFSPDGTQIKLSVNRGLEVYPIENDFTHPVARYKSKKKTENELLYSQFAPDGGMLICRLNKLELYKSRSKKPVTHINLKKYLGKTSMLWDAAINDEYRCAVLEQNLDSDGSGDQFIHWWDLRKKNTPYCFFKLDPVGLIHKIGWFSESSLIAMIAHNSLKVYNPKGAKVCETHKDQVINDLAVRNTKVGIVTSSDIEIFDAEGKSCFTIENEEKSTAQIYTHLALHQRLPLIVASRLSNKITIYEHEAMLS